MRRLIFSALVEVIDDLGGLDIPLSYAEIEHMNNYCVETSKLTGKDYTPLEKPEPKPDNNQNQNGSANHNQTNQGNTASVKKQ